MYLEILKHIINFKIKGKKLNIFFKKKAEINVLKTQVPIALICLIFVSITLANPISEISRSKAKATLKKELLETYGNSYATVEWLLKEGMKDYDILCTIPDNAVNNGILLDLKKTYYPHFSTILFLYKSNKNAYNKLDNGTPLSTKYDESSIQYYYRNDYERNLGIIGSKLIINKLDWADKYAPVKNKSSLGTSNNAEIGTKVIRVIDGVTIEVSYKKKSYSKGTEIRLIGVCTPGTVYPNKSVEYSGREAADFTTRMLEGKRVILKFDKNNQDINHWDRCRRLLAYVYLIEGKEKIFFNAELIKQGYAHVSTKFPFVYFDEFRRYENLARKNKESAKK